MKSHQLTLLISLTIIIISSFGFVGCNSIKSDDPNKYSQSESIFEVSIPEPLQAGEYLFLELVDEVTGVSLNPSRFEMQAKDELHYSVRIPLVTGATIQYRYVKKSTSNIIESLTNGQKVYYRMYLAKGPSVVTDAIAGWDDRPYQNATGEISGYIYDSNTEAPLNEILVFISGMRTFTGSDGFFELKNVPLGEHHLVATHPNGIYQTFQQAAIIAENALTPASFGMVPVERVNVTFNVNVPVGTPSNSQIRLLGNTLELGNAYSDLGGGTGIVPSRSPILDKVDDRKYRISIELPVGYDLKYKYSLGDGFINAEHDVNGNFTTRELIVPARDISITNSIETWSSTEIAPVIFNVNSPVTTPQTDIVSIQFNPYTWMPAIPMWKTSENQWSYALFGPFEYLDQSQYRFCRNDQCGVADDLKTPGQEGLGYILSLEPTPPAVVDYSMEAWVGLESFGYEIIQDPLPIKSEAYIKGIQIDNRYDFSWLPYMPWGFVDAAVNGANWIVFSPSWEFKNINDLPSIQFFPNINPSENDLSQIIKFADESSIVLALFPIPDYEVKHEKFWLDSPKTYNWWHEWFDHYERFLLSYADLASKYDIPALIIGGNQVSPAFPNGKLSDGSTANTPYEFKDKWQELVVKIKEHYDGLLIFALPSSSTIPESLDFINQADLIYYSFDHPLSDTSEPILEELEKNVENVLDANVYQLYATYKKPILLSLNYPSINGSSYQCTNNDNACAIEKINSSEIGYLDMKEQADVYQAIIRAALKRDWIFGIIANGYNPSVSVQNLSSSIRGKPALSVISYYFRAISN